MNLVEIFTKFPKQEDCIAFLEEKRWHNKTVCPYCGYVNPAKRPDLDTIAISVIRLIVCL